MSSRIKRSHIYLYIGYILLALGLSPLTTQMFPQIGNIIEPFILLGVIIIYRNTPYKIPFINTFKQRKSIVCLFLLMVLAIIGYFTPTIGINLNEVPKLIYADFRSCYLFIYTLLLLHNKQWITEQKVDFLKKLLWLIIFMGFYYSYNRISANVMLQDGGSVERTLGIPMHFLVAQNLLYCKESKIWPHLILLAMGAYYATFSFARINILFFVVQVLIVATPLMLKKSKTLLQSLAKFTFLVAIVVSLAYVVPKAYDFYSSSEGGRAQIARITGNFDSVSKSEGERTKSLYVPFTEADWFLLPEGLGWRNHIKKIGEHFNYQILSTQDSCWLYMFYHFGLIGGLIGAWMLIHYVFRFLSRAITHFSLDMIEKTYMLFAFLVGFFTQGIYFTVPQNAVGGGIMLALTGLATSSMLLRRRRPA